MALEHDIRWPGSDLPQDIFVGVDLGQAHDYTAIVVVEGCQYHDFYRVVSLERMRHVDYPIIVKRVEDIVNSYVRTGENTHLIVDKTGVGAPVVDLMFTKNLNPVGISISGEGKPICTFLNQWKSRQSWTCPKRDLVHNLLLQAQLGKFRVLDTLPLAQVLLDEMLNFKIKIDIKTGHDSYGTWREGEHDDLVLAVALALWWAENRPSLPIITTPRCV